MLDRVAAALTLLDGMECLALILDGQGRVVFANRAAVEKLRPAEETAARLATELRPIALGGQRARVVLNSLPGSCAWRGHVWPVEGDHTAALLWPAGIRSGDAAVLAARLGLSADDARLAVRVLAGKTNGELARALRLNINTMKARVARMYQRVGVGSRGAFVALAMAHLREEREG
jgi:DNA-binding CsgD family transcriptional regulator